MSFSGIKKSFLTVKDLKIEVFHFILKDSKSTKNFQNFGTKADTVCQKMKIWDPFYFLNFRLQNVKFQTKKNFKPKFHSEEIMQAQ